MGSTIDLTAWHIQCIWPRLRTSEEKSEYISNVNMFINRAWKGRGGHNQATSSRPIPPKLEVAEVENSTMTYRGASMNVVRLRFKLPDKHQEDDDLFLNAVHHFCTRIFDLRAEGEIRSIIGLICRRSLLGITPLSRWFRFCWTQGFLNTFVHNQVPVFNDLADADLLTPWLRGAALIAVAVGDGNASRLVQAIRIAIPNLLPETRRPDSELERQSDQKSKNFCQKVEKLLRHLSAASKACATQRESGKGELPSDFDLALFDAVLEVLETGFDVLTINKEVFDEWQEVVSSAARKTHLAGAVTVGSLAVVVGSVIKAGSTASAAGVAAGTVTAEAAAVATVGAAAGTTATGTAAGAAATGATLGSTLCSAAVLGPLAMFFASAGLCAINYYYKRKASQERDRLKKLSEKIRGQYESAQQLTQWLISFSIPQTASQGVAGDGNTEMQEMGAQLRSEGLTEAYSLADYQASLDSKADAIHQQLNEMKSDPLLKEKIFF